MYKLSQVLNVLDPDFKLIVRELKTKKTLSVSTVRRFKQFEYCNKMLNHAVKITKTCITDVFIVYV